jgi:hypothetical protein
LRCVDGFGDGFEIHPERKNTMHEFQERLESHSRSKVDLIDMSPSFE